MPSAARLTAGLQERSAAAADAVARAGTATEHLMAQVESLRSLVVFAARVDPEGADAIVKRTAGQVSEAVSEVRALVQHHITQQQQAKRKPVHS